MWIQSSSGGAMVMDYGHVDMFYIADLHVFICFGFRLDCLFGWFVETGPAWPGTC